MELLRVGEKEELQVINDYFISRELRGAGGGGGGGKSGGGGSRSHEGGGGGGGGSGCRTVHKNVTVNNVTTLTSSRECPHISTMWSLLAIIPGVIILLVCIRMCRERVEACRVKAKAVKCSHQLTQTTAKEMRNAGYYNYTEGWICDHCNSAFRGVLIDTPFFRCSTCQVDYCEYCMRARALTATASATPAQAEAQPVTRVQGRYAPLSSTVPTETEQSLVIQHQEIEITGVATSRR